SNNRIDKFAVAVPLTIEFDLTTKRVFPHTDRVFPLVSHLKCECRTFIYAPLPLLRSYSDLDLLHRIAPLRLRCLLIDVQDAKTRCIRLRLDEDRLGNIPVS